MRFLSGLIAELPFYEPYESVHLDTEELAAFLEPFTGKAVYSAYAFSPTPISGKGFLDLAIMSAEGLVDAEAGYAYSEWTVDTYGNGEIGGHDILDIFENHLGEYGAICIDTEPLDLTSLGE